MAGRKRAAPLAGRSRDSARGPRPRHESDPGAVDDTAPRGSGFITTRVEVEGREEIKVVERPEREPYPWGTDAALTVVGTRAPRADALEKVTGRARYTSDVRRGGMLHAALLRSPIARGTVARLDLLPALAIPGVRDAIARQDVPAIRTAGSLLFDATIRYAGQPLAAVCADSEEIAHAALRAIRLELVEELHAATVDRALAPGAPSVKGGAGGNVKRNTPRVAERGDVAAGLAAADVVIEREFRTPVALHSAMEPHGAVAEWNGDDLTVWESTQGIFAVRKDIAEAFSLPLSRVRVLMQYMGGGFGAKNEAGPYTYAAVALARRTGRAVRCILDREGEQTDTGNRPATVQRVTLGARRDGTLTAIVLDATIPLGIGGWEGGPGAIYHELYRCDNVRTSERYVFVNAPAMSSFRAPGHAEGAFGLERAIDMLARELGMDPLALRLANHAELDQRRGRPYSAKGLDGCYREGARRFGWPGWAESAGAATTPRQGYLRRGIGMASQVWGGGGGPPAYAFVRMNSDGSVEVFSGTQDLGTGARTIFAQIAAEAIGARLADVRVVLGDTERTPFTSNSWGSITTASVGPAVRLAAIDARERLLDAASGFLDAPADRLEIAESVVRVRDDDVSLTFAELGEKLGDVMIIGRGNRGPNPDALTLATFGAQFAEVEVDERTGIVRVLRIVAVHDAGRIINPTLAESQLEGGIIQGLGYALFEERILDARLGVAVNPTLHDYKVPTMADIPAIDARCLGVADTAANHTGAKGLAEPPIIPTAPAIANAVANALGVEIAEIPLTPWRVLDAIERRAR